MDIDHRWETKQFVFLKLPEDKLQDLFQCMWAEFLAMTLFVLAACGAASATGVYELVALGAGIGTTLIEVSLVFGFSIISLVYMIGPISGGHVNNAVTWGLFFSGNISFIRAIFYTFGHVTGAIASAGLLRAILPLQWETCFALNLVSSSTNIGSAFLAEALMTMFLTMVVGGAVDKRNNAIQVPLAVGVCVSVAHFFLIPLTGCSINPTRAFASAIAASGRENCLFNVRGGVGVWQDHWLFWIAPYVGGIVGSLIYEYTLRDDWVIQRREKEKVKDLYTEEIKLDEVKKI
eukprot:TRINITY_DN2218_c0_g1_i1.p1 TRINITY_DN2218_c0_g1~~TRINITY_DN2218_c0_g1_i1.p1  ORF type:complete len:291 (-),score=84.32 TRINITY_DN2218_c0_g1_i1:57-929(-)